MKSGEERQGDEKWRDGPDGEVCWREAKMVPVKSAKRELSQKQDERKKMWSWYKEKSSQVERREIIGHQWTALRLTVSPRKVVKSYQKLFETCLLLFWSSLGQTGRDPKTKTVLSRGFLKIQHFRKDFVYLKLSANWMYDGCYMEEGYSQNILHTTGLSI